MAQTQTASVSMVQRRLRVGYTRAGRLIDMLERRGVISGYEGSKPRQVLITEADVSRVLATGGARASGRRSPASRPDEQLEDVSPRERCVLCLRWAAAAIAIGRTWQTSARPCAKRASATRSTSPTSRRRRRSVRSTCARSRTRSGSSCRAPPTSRRSCAPMPQFLGLDAHLLVEEYSARFEQPEELERARPSRSPARCATASRRRRAAVAGHRRRVAGDRLPGVAAGARPDGRRRQRRQQHEGSSRPRQATGRARAPARPAASETAVPQPCHGARTCADGGRRAAASGSAWSTPAATRWSTGAILAAGDRRGTVPLAGVQGHGRQRRR